MDLQWQGLEARLVNSVIPVVEVVANNMDDIKVGDIIECVDKGNNRRLTLGKTYEVTDIDIGNDRYFIRDDSGVEGSYYRSRFRGKIG
jgi:hypothetical protein